MVFALFCVVFGLPVKDGRSTLGFGQIAKTRVGAVGQPKLQENAQPRTKSAHEAQAVGLFLYRH